MQIKDTSKKELRVDWFEIQNFIDGIIAEKLPSISDGYRRGDVLIPDYVSSDKESNPYTVDSVEDMLNLTKDYLDFDFSNISFELIETIDKYNLDNFLSDIIKIQFDIDSFFNAMIDLQMDFKIVINKKSKRHTDNSFFIEMTPFINYLRNPQYASIENVINFLNEVGAPTDELMMLYSFSDNITINQIGNKESLVEFIEDWLESHIFVDCNALKNKIKETKKIIVDELNKDELQQYILSK